MNLDRLDAVFAEAYAVGYVTDALGDLFLASKNVFNGNTKTGQIGQPGLPDSPLGFTEQQIAERVRGHDVTPDQVRAALLRLHARGEALVTVAGSEARWVLRGGVAPELEAEYEEEDRVPRRTTRRRRTKAQIREGLDRLAALFVRCTHARAPLPSLRVVAEETGLPESTIRGMREWKLARAARAQARTETRSAVRLDGTRPD